MMTPMSSDSILDGFELVPDTPASMKGGLGVGICLDDFDAPNPLKETYCQQLNEKQYQEQATSETEKALQELVSFLNKDKSLFRQLMQKRKLEEIEQAGMMSFLKAKLFVKLQGDRYRKSLITDSECETRIKEVTEGMMKAYNYSQETKFQRYNTRQAAKQRARETVNQNCTPFKDDFTKLSDVKNDGKKATVPSATRPPPPPPCPPPALSPARASQNTTKTNPQIPSTSATLTDSTNISPRTPNLRRRALRKPAERADSVKTVHEELLSSNPLKRLRTTKKPRSPGGTPVKNKRMRTSMESLNWDTPARVNTPNSETLTTLLTRIMEQKFKNVRSPSPATPGRLNMTASPQAGFTP